MNYHAPRWLPGGHLQTVYPVLCAPRPPVHYRRQRWDTADGDFIDLDWAESGDHAAQPDERHASPNVAPGTPLIALFHGLEGSSRSHYAAALMSATLAQDWTGVVIHFRGCSGEANRLPRAYHSGDSTEIDWILRRLKAEHPRCDVLTVGVSLGGNALLKWLGEQGDAATPIVSGACAISAPVDLMAAGEALGQGLNRLYARHFLTTLKRKSLDKLRRFPGLFDRGRLIAASTLREFDDAVTAPLHGFADTDDYWTRASSKPWLRSIAVPTLLVNARNDPFLPDRALPQAAELSPQVTPEFPDEGGHAGFVRGHFPGSLDWLPKHVFEFFNGLSVR